MSSGRVIAFNFRLPQDVRQQPPTLQARGGDVVEFQSASERYGRLVEREIPSMPQSDFTQWRDFIYNRVYASWAYRVGLEHHVPNNMAAVREAWEQGLRGYERWHADVGLAAQLKPLVSALEFADPGMRFEALALASFVLEELAPTFLTKQTAALAGHVRRAALPFLDDGIDAYIRASVIFALQRTIPAQPKDDFPEARSEVLRAYVACLNTENSGENRALLSSFAGLLEMFGSDISPVDFHFLKLGEMILIGTAKSDVSDDVRELAEVALEAMPKMEVNEGEASGLYGWRTIIDEWWI